MKKILAFAALIGIAAAGTTWNIRRHDSPLGLTPQEKCALRDAPHDDLSADFSDLRQNMKNGARKLTHDLAAEKTARATLSIQGPILNGIFDADVPAGIQGQMRADMAFIDDIQANAASALHQKIFGPANGRTYMDFFTSRVKEIGLDDCGGGPGVMACVQPYTNHSKMWLTPNFVKYDMPQICRAQIVFHESRHTEKKNSYWHHATCPDPFKDENDNEVRGKVTGTPMAGLAACDETPYGSYGSSMIMVKNIQKFCTNCTEKIKMDAGIYADDTLRRIIDPDAHKEICEDLYRDAPKTICKELPR